MIHFTLIAYDNLNHNYHVFVAYALYIIVSTCKLNHIFCTVMCEKLMFLHLIPSQSIFRIMLGMHNNEKIEKIKILKEHVTPLHQRKKKEIIIIIISENLMRSKLFSLMETTKKERGVGSSKTLTKKEEKKTRCSKLHAFCKQNQQRKRKKEN